MKINILIIGIVFLMLVGIVTASSCYQESADISTDCGGVSTGSYDNGYGLCWYSPTWIYDGDWETFSAMDVADCPYLKVNYTKPINALPTSKWKIREGEIMNPSVYVDYELSIPSECWNAYVDKVSFNIKGYNTMGGAGFHNYCYNGSDWVIIKDYEGMSDEGETWLYEEAMNWDIKVLTPIQQKKLILWTSYINKYIININNLIVKKELLLSNYDKKIDLYKKQIIKLEQQKITTNIRYDNAIKKNINQKELYQSYINKLMN